MKRLLLLSIALLTAPAAAQGVYVQGHYRSDGTYVPGHWRSAPNSSRLDNYSTEGNINPYTGNRGTVNPYPVYPSYPTYTPQTRPFQPTRPLPQLKPLQPYTPYTPPCYYDCD